MSASFISACYSHILVTTDIRKGTQISPTTWPTVHDHTVADAFLSKESSSALLVHGQQAYHKNDVFQILIELLALTTRKNNIYK